MPTPRSAPSPAPLQGILLLLLAALTGLALASHSSEAPLSGPWADWAADRILRSLGPVLTWALWALVPPFAIQWMLGRSKRGLLARAALLAPVVLVVTIAFSPMPVLHGRFGAASLALFQRFLGPWGSWIAVASLGCIAVWLLWRFLIPVALRDGTNEAVGGIASRAAATARSVREARPWRARAGDEEKDERERPGARGGARARAGGSRHPEPDAEELDEEDEESGNDSEDAALLEPRIRERRLARALVHPPVRPQDPAAHILPAIDLLEDVPGTENAIDRDEILETSRLLTRTLKDFGVIGKVGEVQPGPVVTRYEFEPAAGVRVAQIVSRIDDLALALRAGRIRIVAPIPGKAAVGIEVPNRRPALISLKEILGAEEFRKQDAPLTLALGRDVAGAPVFSRLDQMPHLLVAGTTGSGKSVGLNCFLLSLLFRRTPEELRFLMIDPKRLELTPYDGIPALLCPVITEPRRATRMLEWLCAEMDRRYRVFSQIGAKGIEAYRKKAASTGEGESMPYVVVVVDELADLMLTQGAEIEGPISRLAHMARAVGIHLVLATQRPSVDVLTGVIKANFPARIAFQVASRIDSRTILDAGGAEFLLGKGDMLFVPPGKGEAVRVHGAYCSEADAERVAAFLREQPPAAPLVPEEEEEGVAADPARQDELFEEALRIVLRERQASVSFLQRRLKVGYSRAGRLMDLLEAAGVVSPYDGSKARDVIVGEGFLEEWNARKDSQLV
jgi:DNA segregation ATPase FtsK/SpoIIIE-like protein